MAWIHGDRETSEGCGRRERGDACRGLPDPRRLTTDAKNQRTVLIEHQISVRFLAQPDAIAYAIAALRRPLDMPDERIGARIVDLIRAAAGVVQREVEGSVALFDEERGTFRDRDDQIRPSGVRSDARIARD